MVLIELYRIWKKYGIVDEYEDETGESQPNARCDSQG